MDSLAEVQQVLAASSEDAEGAVENIEEYQEALDQIREALGETSEFLEEASEALGEVAEGVEEFGEQAAEVAEVVGKIHKAMEKVEELRGLSEATASEQIRALGDLIGDVAGWLGDLVDFIPGLGAFLEIWSLAIDSLSSSAATLESIVIRRNREADDAGVTRPFVILQVGASARAERIQEITDRLEELGVDVSPPAQTAEGETIPADVQNAILLGLRDSGMTYHEFITRSEEVKVARGKVNALAEEVLSANAAVVGGRYGDIPESEAAAAEAKLPELKASLAEAIEDYESKAAIIQPCVDAMFGYMGQYAPEEVRNEWEPWMHSEYDPSYFLGPAGIDAIRHKAGISAELGIPESWSELEEEDEPAEDLSDTGEDSAEDDDSDAAFDEMVAQLPAQSGFESDEDIDLDEFSPEPADSRTLGIPLAGVVAAGVLLAVAVGAFILFNIGSGDPVAQPEVPATGESAEAGDPVAQPEVPATGESAAVEEPEESVAVGVGAEALVGSYRGALMFFPPPGDPSTVVFEATFMVTVEPDEGDGYAVIFTQEPSSQVTVGRIDPTGRALYTSGGDESKYQEFYLVQVRPIGSHQLEIVGVHFGGPPDLAEREEELLLALTSAEIVDGVLVVAPGADPITGGPLSPAQALAVATEMILPGVDRTELGIDWFLVVHGVLDLSDSTETSTGVPEHEVTIGGVRYVIRAVTEVRTGANLGFTVCGYDVDSGEPLEGMTGYFTIGNDPGSSLASHANGTFGSDGCFSGSVPVQEPPGITQGFVSDGSAVEKWGDITILPGEDPPEEDPEQFLRLLVEGLRGDADFLVSRLNDATIAIYGEDQCRATLAGLQDPQTELEIREIGPTAPWDYVVDGITTRIPDALPVEVQRLADGQTIIQELHWQQVDGLWTWFSDCGEPIPG